ncbi:DUF305 domain-containing protein [Frankia sp. AgPm24]|uniref:DUF305 domain-containing protein n=1 Tax=Frankia sp. AgPm24 TaxID=631128 RepID=UPI00200C96F7|nr:DUF305 domain-containing protein [Frankia sp. AgPm24]MCK9925389.1 DUF305 domain-containing protein [Frankia sp. AgPm24]
MKRIVQLIAALLAATVVAACGGDTPDHNSVDTRFAQAMIPHHQQAVDMVDLVATRTQNTRVRTLATRIHAAQTPEITTMTGWLADWSEPVPSAANAHQDGHQEHTHGAGHTGPGMMSDEDMTALANTSGAAFDTMFLTMMIDHHQGAIDMASTEIQGGRYAPAKDLAARIRTTQTTEIAAMRTLLATV